MADHCSHQTGSPLEACMCVVHSSLAVAAATVVVALRQSSACFFPAMHMWEPTFQSDGTKQQPKQAGQ